MLSRLLLLLLGTGITSVGNFWIYVVLASADSTGDFGRFIKANYLGGLYLFGVASSVGTVALFAFERGGGAVLRRYGMICGAIAGALALGCLAQPAPAAALGCLLAAMAMQMAGLFIAALIRQDKSLWASLLPPLHPLMFWIGLHLIPADSNSRWVPTYIAASLVLSILFAAVGAAPLRAALQQAPSQGGVGWRDIGSRMLLSVSFGAVLQADQIVAGVVRRMDVAAFAVTQKMYASVATAFSGATVQLLLRRIPGPLVGRRGGWMLGVSLLCSLATFLAIELLRYLHKSRDSAGSELLLLMGVAALYYCCCFANTLTTVSWPAVAYGAMLVAMIAYLGALLMEHLHPMDGQALLPIGVFFTTYLGASLLLVGRRDGH